MDVTALVFYGAICALLSFASPSLGTPLLRLLIGGVVGILAAALLPILRATLAL